MKYILFENEIENNVYHKLIEYTIEPVKANLYNVLKNNVTIMDFIWNLISFNKCTLYLCRNEDRKIIHRSRVVGKNFKYKFLDKHQAEIGPCYTSKDYRGKGIYPAVLSFILNENKFSKYYMLVREDNESSLRGVRKAGFKECGFVAKTKRGWIRE